MVIFNLFANRIAGILLLLDSIAGLCWWADYGQIRNCSKGRIPLRNKIFSLPSSSKHRGCRCRQFERRRMRNKGEGAYEEEVIVVGTGFPWPLKFLYFAACRSGLGGRLWMLENPCKSYIVWWASHKQGNCCLCFMGFRLGVVGAILVGKAFPLLITAELGWLADLCSANHLLHQGREDCRTRLPGQLALQFSVGLPWPESCLHCHHPFL